jgi:hypothetical protein
LLNARSVGDPIEQPRDVADAADHLQFFAALKLLDQGNDVNWPRTFREVPHSGVDSAMRVQHEIMGRQVFNLRIERIIQQDGAKDGTLGIQIDWPVPQLPI